MGIPHSTLELERLLQEVKRRLGQSVFRLSLLNAYDSKCAVTGCIVVEALEAAHIEPHIDSTSNEVANGLLLRADIHTLFDRHLIGVDPASKTIVIAKKLAGTSYEELNGKPLSEPMDAACQPSLATLEARWERFLKEES